MANTLGTISVDLVANTASFVTGLATASSHAKKFGSETTEAFSRIGEIAGSALAPFGEIGRVIGETLGRIGALGGSAAQSIAKMSGGMSLLAVGGGVAVGAIAAVEAAAIGMAIHTAEAAASMLILSQSTGVSVATLSGFSFVAKQMGVDQDTLVRGLEKLSKSIFTAATAAPGTTTAFSRMGIAVRDSNGNIRDAGDVIVDVAKKFEGMNDGTVKTALAIQLFGRGGAAIIPMLNGGKEAIDKWLQTAKDLGIVLDQDTAKSAHRFEQNLNTIKAAADGLSLRLTKALLPALEAVSKAMTEGLKDKSSNLNGFIDGIKTLTQYFISFGGLVVFVFEEIGAAASAVFADIVIDVEEIIAEAKALKNLDFKGIAAAQQDAKMKHGGVSDDFLAHSKANWKSYTDLLTNAFKETPDSQITEHGDKPKINTKPEKEDSVLERIKERIAAIQREAAEWLKIGQAGSQAEQLIAEAVKKGTDEYGKLRDMAAKEKDPTRRAAALSFVESNEGLIEGSAAAGVYGAAIKGIVSELDKQHLKLTEETSATEALTAAYRSGSVTAALVNAHFADQSAKVRVLKEAHDLLVFILGEENAVVKQLADGYALASKELDADKVDYAAKVHAELNLEIQKSTTSFYNELPALNAIANAYFDTAAAARAAQVELRVAQFKTANPTADEGQVNRVRELETQKSKQAFANSTAEQAAKYDLVQTYSLEIQRLSELREKLQEYGRSTLLVDSAERDLQRRTIEQWDEAALKVGTYGQKFRAVMNQVVLDGQDFGTKLFQSIGKAIDGLSSSLAKFVVTGKGSFKQIFQSLEEEIVKAGIQKGFSSILGKLAGGGKDGEDSQGGAAGAMGLLGKIPVVGGILGKLGGLFGGDKGLGKADGSQANPFYVISAGGDSSGGDGIGGLLSSFLGGGESGGDGGGIGGALGGLASIFGGFLAEGGDVTPGKAYVVGEKHPEFFVPRQSGRVTPSLSMGGTTHHTTHVEMHIHGVTNFDSFKRSEPQIHAGLQHQVGIAYRRTRN
jgi:hypothetical protein